MAEVRPASHTLAPERSLHVAALLTLSGGFLDAFTYVAHGQVFANSMTGNVALLGIYAASGAWSHALRHVPPVMAFLVGVFLAHVISLSTAHRRPYRPALICLGLEVVCLAAAACLPAHFPDVLLVLMISLVAAMQNSSFTRLETWAYNSVMTTGNLRRCAEGVFRSLMPVRDRGALRQARQFGIICLCFFVGAILGAVATPHLQNAALWVPAGMLALAYAFCWPGASRGGY